MTRGAQMALVLQIETSETYDFFVLYDNLSPLRQKIWNKIVQCCRDWTICVPAQATLAGWCGCSRSAVSEAFKIFKDYGWMSLQSRGWKRSKKIFIPHSKQQIDVIGRNYFKKIEATYRATYISSTYKKRTSKDGLSASKPLDIPIWLMNLKISQEAKLKLSLLPESIFQETHHQCKRKAKLGFKPENEENYFVGTAFKIAEKKGVTINWRSYYEGK